MRQFCKVTMKIYVTSRQQATLDLWSGLLSASTVIELVNDSDRKVQADAIVNVGRMGV
jgi:hypothetical protein